MTAAAPPKIPWGRNSKLFAAFLDQGFKYQRYICDLLLAHDIDVTMPRMRVRKSIAAAKDFKDEPDAIANGKVLEIKSRSLEFYRTLDLPTTVLLDTTEGWESKITKPFGYVVVSQITGAAVWTQGEDNSDWTVVRTHDRKRDINVVCYAERRLRFEPIKTLIAKLKELSLDAK